MDFRCHYCGCIFEADPSSFILDTEEAPLEVEYDPEEEDGIESMDDFEFASRVQMLTKEELRGLTYEQLDDIGMSPELRDMILAKVHSDELCDGAVALCKPCRDAIGLCR